MALITWFPFVARGTPGGRQRRRVHSAKLVAVIALALPLSSAIAQAVPAATPADSDAVAATVITRSFKGIRISRADSLIASHVVKRSFMSLLSLNGKMMGDETLTRIDAMYEQEDAGLLALVKSAADSARYLSNSAPWHPVRPKRPRKP